MKFYTASFMESFDIKGIKWVTTNRQVGGDLNACKMSF